MTDERIIAHVKRFIELHNYDQAYELARSINNCKNSIDVEMFVLQEEAKFMARTQH